jgi:hypothetical protein
MKKSLLFSLLFSLSLFLHAQVYRNKLLGIPNGRLINFNLLPGKINNLPVHPYVLTQNILNYNDGDTMNPFDEKLLYECF